MLNLKVYYGADKHGFFWPESAQKRQEWLQVKRNRPADAQAIYQCNPGAREGSIFLESDFAYYGAPPGLDRGVESNAVRKMLEMGIQLAVGWDTAFEATSVADFTAGVPALLVPCSQYHCNEDPLVYGECEPHLDVLLLGLLYEKLTWADLVPQFRLMHKRWEPYIHVVEKRGSGISLYQSMPLAGINVLGVAANESKRARAIQGVGAGSVQGWFRQHRVLFPMVNGEYPAWVKTAKTQLKDFSGAKDASDDIVDAIVHLVTYAIRLGSGMALLPTEQEVERVLKESESAQSDDPRVQFLNWLGAAPGLSDDPFEHTCARCNHYGSGFCTKFMRPMIAMDGIDCMEFAHA